MKTIKQCIFIISTAVFLVTSSCIEDIRVRGNGIEATEGRIVSEFVKVKSSGAFEVHITEGDQFEVIVSADENVIQYIDTYVSGGALHLETRGMLSIRNKLPMEIYITTTVLEGITLSGSGNITTDYFLSDKMNVFVSGSGKIKTGFETDEADINISGSGVIELSGFAQRANFRISGSGNINALNLSTVDCYTSTSGSGDMWVSTERFLEAKISGSGNVYYYGEPTVETHISGSGNVLNRN